jgi:hypothetical protein
VAVNTKSPLMARGFAWGAAVPGLLLFIFVVAWSRAQEPMSKSAGVSSRALFDADGRVHLPNGYRRWANVGTRYKASGRNILDGKPIVTPQMMNTYIEPSALDHYKETGKWPDGAQIVKELSEIRVGKDCDEVTHICSAAIGSGIFQEQYTGVGMMAKDSKRFSDVPGNWGYFGFFRKKSGYETVAHIRPQDQCASCHVKLASDTDYVISKAHLGLSSENIQ